MGLVQDGEGGGQLVVERTDLEQVRTGEVYPYTHIHSALHICMEGYGTCSILGYWKCLDGKIKCYLRRVTPKAPQLLKMTHRVQTSR